LPIIGFLIIFAGQFIKRISVSQCNIQTSRNPEGLPPEVEYQSLDEFFDSLKKLYLLSGFTNKTVGQ
jgi:hypothetical protein